MTPPDAPDAPRDYSTGEESPREACANLAMAFRSYAEDASRSGKLKVWGRDLLRWATRLERACQRLDAEKAGKP